HGDFAASWRLHRLGWLMAVALLLQCPYRLICLSRGRSIFGTHFPVVIGYLILGLLVGNWLVDAVGNSRQKQKGREWNSDSTPNPSCPFVSELIGPNAPNPAPPAAARS